MKSVHLQNVDQLIGKLSERFSEKFIENRPLADLTTFRIGGPARLFVNCTEKADLIDAAGYAVECGVPFFLLGGGSNVLVSDRGYSGLVVHNATSRLTINADAVTVDSGYNLEKLVTHCCESGLAGLELLAGIKGSVGGAVYGNAGAFGGAISDNLLEAEIFAPGQTPRWEPKNYFAFRYRHSILKETKEIVLAARIRVTEESAEKLLAKQAEILALRDQRHPDRDCSAGCFFKNIEKAGEPYGKVSAGYLLEQVGAKAMQVGAARVFEKHANILINGGGATASEVRELSSLLKQKVRDRFGYSLEEEIIFLGD